MNVRENVINELLSSFRFVRHEAIPESHPLYNTLIVKDSGIRPTLCSVQNRNDDMESPGHDAIPESTKPESAFITCQEY